MKTGSFTKVRFSNLDFEEWKEKNRKWIWEERGRKASKRRQGEMRARKKERSKKKEIKKVYKF